MKRKRVHLSAWMNHETYQTTLIYGFARKQCRRDFTTQTRLIEQVSKPTRGERAMALKPDKSNTSAAALIKELSLDSYFEDHEIVSNSNATCKVINVVPLYRNTVEKMR